MAFGKLSDPLHLGLGKIHLEKLFDLVDALGKVYLDRAFEGVDFALEKVHLGRAFDLIELIQVR